MSNVKTTTTNFKKALKTVTDTLTATEQKMYDVGIEIEYTGEEGTITMQHPTNEMFVMANFKGEKHESRYHVSFYIGDLVDKLKPFRRKEDLYLDTGLDSFVLSSDDGIVFETAIEGSGYDVHTFDNTYKCNRKKLIEVLRIGQAVNRTTFSESTTSLHMVAVANKLHIRATNLSLLSMSELFIKEGRVEKPFEVTLSSKEATKVRNVLERGTGKNVYFAKHKESFMLMTDSTKVVFKDEDLTHVDASKIIKALKWEREVYELDTEISSKVVRKQYERLRTAEDEKNEANITLYQNIYLKKKDESKELMFLTEQQAVHVNTRSMNSVLNRLPKKMQVAFNDKAIMLNHSDDDYKTMLLIPVAKM